MNRWWERASCRGLGGGDDDLFFPDETTTTMPTAACVMCFECPVKLECRMEGYAESFGYWGNTSADWRVRNRRKIFRRLWPIQTMALDEHESLRTMLRALVVRSKGDIIKGMYLAGFNRAEVTAFADFTPLDRRAHATIARQEKQHTTYAWRLAQRTPVGAL